MIKHVHESVTKIKLLSIAHVSFVFYNDLIHQPHVKNTKEQNSANSPFPNSFFCVHLNVTLLISLSEK